MHNDNMKSTPQSNRISQFLWANIVVKVVYIVMLRRSMESS